MPTKMGFVIALSVMVALPAHAEPRHGAGIGQDRARGGAMWATEPSIAGKWNLSLEGPQGAMAVTLTLKLDGSKVTGTFANPQFGGDAPLSGEYKDGKLSFTVSLDGGPGGAMSLGFTAKFKDKDDDTLVGNLAGPMGDVPWTATRVKEK